MFIVQLDDIADKEQKQKLFGELVKIPFQSDFIKTNHLNLEDKKYLIFTQKLWNYIKKQVKNYSNYENLKRIFEYDIYQIFNSMKYSCLVNENPWLINKAEFWLYLPNNMAFMLGLMINLMGASKFNFKNIGALREIICEAQKIGRISNWLSTWRREVKEDDFTSGIFAYAIKKDILKADDIKILSKNKIVEKIRRANIEIYLLRDWQKYFNNIKKYIKCKFIDIEGILEGQKQLLFLDLITVDYK
jgi:hypothetical protein